LLQTTEAVRLLGAATILSGISPTVAKTVVRLGVNVSNMHTVSRLAEGIDLGMGLVRRAARRRVTARPSPRRPAGAR
jgi:rsbT co-antagonist protein RsbR